MKRKLTASEFNHLIRNNIDPFVLPDSEKPIEYISGSAEFCGLDFFVNKYTLIPRIETEELVELIFNNIKANKELKTLTFIDVGCGSGAIGLTLATKLLKTEINFNIVLSDIFTKALLVAQQNLKSLFKSKIISTLKNSNKSSFETKYILENKNTITIIQSDLLSEFIESDQKFDFIVANLPYILSQRLNTLEKSVKDFEPLLALNGGKDGFDLISRLFKQANELKHIPKTIYLEVDDIHKGDFIDKHNLSDNWNIKILKDKNAKTRFWIASRDL